MGKLIQYIKQPVFDNWYTSEKIGQGIYSEVYKIYSENKISALKVKPVFADSIESLNRKLDVAENEADIMCRLKKCPYIVEYQGKEVRKITNCFYLFMIKMEYLTPFTAQTGMFFNYNNVYKIACDIGKALSYTHKNGIIHCDVKPDNFFRDSSGNYKLGDFNVSKYVGKSNSIAGTKGYIAPEISELGAVCGYQTDIYSFGVSLLNISHRFVISEEFSEIIKKACASNVRYRYKTVDEMLYDIYNIKTDYYVDPVEYFD